MKWLLKKLREASILTIGIILGTVVFGGTIAYAVQISVPSATSYGQILIGQSTGNYTPTATSSTNFFTLTTTGSSGASTYSAGTLNIPQYGGGGGGGGLSTTTPWIQGQLAFVVGSGTVSSVATGTISAGSSAITVTAGRSAVGGALSIDCAGASASQNGCLSSGDWTTFNGKDSFAYPFTYLGLGTTSPLMIIASTTIGDGSQGNGLTISGGATTTGQLNIANALSPLTTPASPTSWNMLVQSTSGSNGSGVGIGFTDTTVVPPTTVMAGVGAQRIGGIFGDLFFDTSPASNSLLERMRITSKGNVGIGTTTPSVNSRFSIHLNTNDTSFVPLAMMIASSTATGATSTLFSIDNTGLASTTNLNISGLGNCSGSNALTTTSGVVSCGAITGGASFPFTPQIWGNATGTVIGFQGGFISNASSTISGVLNATGGVVGNLTGNASTATALAGNGTNCNAGYFSLGIDASGNAEGCTYTLATTTPWSNGGLMAVNALGLAYDISTTSLNASISGSAGSVANALTINNGGSGVASGGTYNGSAATTISYNSIGAVPTTRNITCAGIITGCGDLSADRTLTVPFSFTPASWGNATGTLLGFQNGFISSASSTVANANLVITGTGSLGIGTTSPMKSLSVVGSEVINPTADAGDVFTVNNSGATQQVLQVGTNATAGVEFGVSSSTWNGTSYATGAFYFGIQGSNGFVGIGTSSPMAQLTIQQYASSTAAVPNPTFSDWTMINNTNYQSAQIDGQGHLVYNGPVPTLSSCGSSPAPTIIGNDHSGTIIVGGTATGCTMTFAMPYPSMSTGTTTCVISERTGSITNVPTYTVSSTNFVYTETALSNDQLDYECNYND